MLRELVKRYVEVHKRIEELKAKVKEMKVNGIVKFGAHEDWDGKWLTLRNTKKGIDDYEMTISRYEKELASLEEQIIELLNEAGIKKAVFEIYEGTFVEVNEYQRLIIRLPNERRDENVLEISN